MTTTKSLKDNNYEQALIDTYLKFDEILRNDKINDYLRKCINPKTANNSNRSLRLADLANEISNKNSNDDICVSTLIARKKEFNSVSTNPSDYEKSRKTKDSQSSVSAAASAIQNIFDIENLLKKLKLHGNEFTLDSNEQENVKKLNYEEILTDFTQKYEMELLNFKDNQSNSCCIAESNRIKQEKIHNKSKLANLIT